MTLDWDEKIRMDCSSPSAMASLIHRKDEYQIATGNDADADRHGIVTPDAGLMNPNHFLAVAIAYLFSGNRPDWPETARIGKTLVSSSMIDRVAASLDKPMVEVPVGFKWFVPGLIDGSFGFGGEESAGASFLRRDGSTWTTDKDGLILCLLASEILAVSGNTPERALRPARRVARRPGVRPRRRARQPRAEGQAGGALPRRRVGDDAGRRGDHRQAHRGARATAPRSAASRSSPRTRGSPRVPRAPRTSTRSTPSRSKAETTSRRSRRKRARWSRLRWADGFSPRCSRSDSGTGWIATALPGRRHPLVERDRGEGRRPRAARLMLASSPITPASTETVGPGTSSAGKTSTWRHRIAVLAREVGLPRRGPPGRRRPSRCTARRSPSCPARSRSPRRPSPASVRSKELLMTTRAPFPSCVALAPDPAEPPPVDRHLEPRRRAPLRSRRP